MNHRCNHPPAYGCHAAHGCRCDHCTDLASSYKAGRNAAIRHEVKRARAADARLVTVPVLDLPWYQDRKADR